MQITREQLPSGKYRYTVDGEVHTAKSNRFYTHASTYRVLKVNHPTERETRIGTRTGRDAEQFGSTYEYQVPVKIDAPADMAPVVYLHSRLDLAVQGAKDANRIPDYQRIPGVVEIEEISRTPKNQTNRTSKEQDMPTKNETKSTPKAKPAAKAKATKPVKTTAENIEAKPSNPRVVAEPVTAEQKWPVKARSTGTTVALVDNRAKQFDADDESAWFTLCIEHNAVAGHANARVASAWRSRPEGWCPKCKKGDHPRAAAAKATEAAKAKAAAKPADKKAPAKKVPAKAKA
jgi:hypothetical protein